MRCKQCGYRLWNLPSRTCPECGTGFLPSEFEFTANSVQFRCPHCDSSYYGTSNKGHLVPMDFDCTGCGRRVHMDEMILLPTSGVEEERTQVDCVPWLERRKRGFFRAWFATIGMALVQPGRLIRALPATGAAGAGWWFAIVTSTPCVLLGVGLLIAFAMTRVSAFSSNILLGAVIPLVIMVAVSVGLTLVIIAIWGLVTHGLLRMTGPTSGPIGRTYEALCYSTGANVGTAIPCIGFYIGWIWWLVSAVIMVKVAQKVQGWRAALAVLLLPGGSIITVIGLYSWVIVSAFSGSGTWATAFSQREANIIAAGMLGYAQDHSGKGPSHALELIAGEYVNAGDLVPPNFSINTRGVAATVRVTPPIKFALMSKSAQDTAVLAAISALPDDVTAHRLGDFVFVHHGIDFNTCDSQLWIIVQSPDPDGGAAQLSTGMVHIGFCDGTVTAVDDIDFAMFLKHQNELRRKLDLSQLPDPRTLRHLP